MSFVNPTRNQLDMWIQEDVKQEVSRSSRLYEEQKYRGKKVADVAHQLNPNEYTNDTDTITLEPGEDLPEIESLTADTKLEKMLSESDVSSVKWGINTEHDEVYPVSGPIEIETRSAQEDEAYQFWIPFLDDKRGEIAGVIQPPYSTPEQFTHSIDRPHRSDSWIEEDALEMAYVAAREMIPEVRPDYTGEYNADWFTGHVLNTSAQDMIAELEKEGEVQIGDSEYIGQQRGGNATDALEKILREAKDRRLIDYTVENDNAENKIRIDNGGYKWLTRDVPELHESIEDLIDTRLTQGTK